MDDEEDDDVSFQGSWCKKNLAECLIHSMTINVTFSTVALPFVKEL